MDRSRFEACARDFARASIALLPVLLLARVYELIIARAAHGFPPGASVAIARGVVTDIALAFWVAAALAVPVLALAAALPRTARVFHRVLLVLLVLMAVPLAQYFAVTFIPLGADLYGYSWHDIQLTVSTNRGVNPLTFLPYVVLGALTWYLTGISQRFRFPRYALAAFGGMVMCSVALAGQLAVDTSDFETEANYSLAANKTVHFIRRSVAYVASHTGGEDTQLSGYPLMHPATYEDVLGPSLQLSADQPPNFVFVIVEGLGRDFVGEGARYGGFMPFLDSLTKRSLYWENCLSNTGRTFGVMPSLFVSAPPVEGGFMGLASRMPKHLSLITLLKQNGYEANFFTGGDSHFDNKDVFLERQGIDHILNESQYPETYVKAPAGQGGFTWGYGDLDVFKRSLEVLGEGATKPRIDVYLTLTSHEPFRPPGEAEYLRKFEERLGALPMDEARRADFRSYANIFSTLMYTDDAVRFLLTEYQKRPEFSRTIFIITGDHRLVPIPSDTRLSRYHVPLIIHSAMVKEPRKFSSVSSHLNMTPTLLGFLSQGWGMRFPDSVHWVGSVIDTAREFRNIHSIPLSRTKTDFDEYLRGTHFISLGDVFELGPGMALHEVNNPAVHDSLTGALDRMRQVSRYVTTRDMMYPAPNSAALSRKDSLDRAQEDSVFAALGLSGLNSDKLFEIARKRAFEKDYLAARVIGRRMLRDAPAYHDVRTLVGRTYAWEGRFAEARPFLEYVIRRAPGYIDARLALIDVEIWAGNDTTATAMIDSSLTRFPGNSELLSRKARTHRTIGLK
jgi:lipoteichoic acid synthase